MDGILGILFIPAKGFLLWVLLQLVTYWLTPGSRGRLSLRRIFALSLYLNFPCCTAGILPAVAGASCPRRGRDALGTAAGTAALHFSEVQDKAYRFTGGDEIIDELYLMSTDEAPHGLQFHDDRIFDHNVGREVSNNFPIVADPDWLLRFSPSRLRRDSMTRHFSYTDSRNPYPILLYTR